jgi:hypothetical protein
MCVWLSLVLMSTSTTLYCTSFVVLGFSSTSSTSHLNSHRSDAVFRWRESFTGSLLAEKASYLVSSLTLHSTTQTVYPHVVISSLLHVDSNQRQQQQVCSGRLNSQEQFGRGARQVAARDGCDWSWRLPNRLHGPSTRHVRQLARWSEVQYSTTTLCSYDLSVIHLKYWYGT